MLISELDTVSPGKATQFANKNINTVEDLVKLLPKKYLDFRTPEKPGEPLLKQTISFVGKMVEKVTLMGKNQDVLRTVLKDKDGVSLTVMWFNQLFLKPQIDSYYGMDVIVCGKLDFNPYFKNYFIANPIVFSSKIEENQSIVPIYKKIKGMSDNYYKDTLIEAMKNFNAKEYLDEETLSSFHLVRYNNNFFRLIHCPKDEKEISAAKRRLIFDDMFYFASRLVAESYENVDTPFVVTNSSVMESVVKNLPYTLTDDQQDTVNQIKNKLASGSRINALVQGDVGCGKTIIAFLSMILCAENGLQSVLMAPTQVLAKQHYDALSQLVEPLGFKVAYLHNGMKAKEKRETLAGISSGECLFVVGTHSVISAAVEYNNLALTITDEEHKFGVAQREALEDKAKDGVHAITMSATPIPRSLAMTLYGENKDIYTISQMPNGRKPIVTQIMNEDDKTFEFMYREIQKGRQCYVVCPLITDSDSDKLADVESVESFSARIGQYFAKYPDVVINTITGKNKAVDNEKIIANFADNKTQILISTTVIEVGVNVPNSSVILVRNAERFGLAQLHQLRGRVGRGNYQSYCLLASTKEDNERLNAMCNTNNGFEIAEADLQQRGTGDLIGTKQSGDDRYVELMLAYPKFFLKVKNRVKELYQIANSLSVVNSK